MKKRLFTVLLAAVLALAALAGCSSGKDDGTAASGQAGGSEKKSTKVVLNEVAHSIFYAPMYVAIEEGYFAEEGIALTLVNGFGADKVLTSLISGEADIGFMGPESSVYAYLEGANDVVVNFAQLTQRAGNFLVGREPAEDFQWEDLKGSYVLGGRKGVVH